MRQEHARARRPLRADRDPGEPRRARAAVPVRARRGRPRRAAADVGVARVRQARGARREAGGERAARGGHLVVGLAVVLGRRQRSRQAGRGVRLPLGARSAASATRLRSAGTFDTSLTEGQLLLPAGVRCTLGDARILKSDVGRTAAVTGDLESAATALLQRAVLRAEQPIDPQTVLAAERAIVRDRFGRSVGALSGGTERSQADARGRARDHRRPARPRPRRGAVPPAPPPRAEQIADFLATYAATQVRLVSVDARGAVARRRVSRLRRRDDRAERGVRRCRRPGARRSTPSTGASRCARSGRRCRSSACRRRGAQDVARGVLGRFARDDVYERWLAQSRPSLLATAVCARDALPVKGDVDLTAWAPFLGD